MNNVIRGNRTTAFGSAVFCTLSSPRITSNTVVANPTQGGALVFDRSTAFISNNIVAYHSTGIAFTAATASTLRNNDLYNPGGKNYLGVSAGVGDISADPKLAGWARNNDRYNPGGSDYVGPAAAGNLAANPLLGNVADGDFHLNAKSPCINAGWNDASGLGTADMDGEVRVYGPAVDIGADEYAGVPLDFIGVRKLDEGASASGYRTVVSAALPNAFYLEAEDRTSGVRVEMPGHSVQVGTRVSLEGAVATNADGERCIVATSAVASGTGSISPLALNNAALGGGTFGYQDAVWGWRLLPPAPGDQPVRTWAKASGLNNIGLLIRTTGRILPGLTTSTSFTIDDGSGVNVKCVVPAGVAIDPAWSRVSVTGISSCEKVTVVGRTELHSVVLIRDASDILAAQ